MLSVDSLFADVKIKTVCGHIDMVRYNNILVGRVCACVHPLLFGNVGEV